MPKHTHTHKHMSARIPTHKIHFINVSICELHTQTLQVCTQFNQFHVHWPQSHNSQLMSKQQIYSMCKNNNNTKKNSENKINTNNIKKQMQVYTHSLFQRSSETRNDQRFQKPFTVSPVSFWLHLWIIHKHKIDFKRRQGEREREENKNSTHDSKIYFSTSSCPENAWC